MKKLQDTGFFGKHGELSPDSDEYKARVQKAVAKWQQKFGSPYAKDAVTEQKESTPQPAASKPKVSAETPAPAAKPAERIVSDEDIAKAEKWKNDGNSKLSSGDFDGAVTCYTEAIKLNPKQAIYPANRAAAYLKIFQFQAAIDDW
jgi:tetratricopeptide (TPR) repeat protein